MPDTVLFLRNLQDFADAHGTVAAEQSASMTATAATTQAPRDLSLIPGTNTLAWRNTVDAAPSTAQQRLLLGKFTSDVLSGITDWPAMLIEFGCVANEGEANLTAFLTLVAYIEKADLTKRGTIIDADVNMSSQLQTGTKGRVFTFNGLHVASVAATDVLVLEVWARAHPAVIPVNPIVRLYYDGNLPPTEGATLVDVASYLKVPISGLFGSNVSPVDVASSSTGTTAIAASIIAPTAVASSSTPTSAVTASIGAITPIHASTRPISTVSASVAGPGSGSEQDIGEHCWGGAQPWLRFGGVEIANLGRMRNYAVQLSPGLVKWGCPPNEIVFRANGLPDVFASPADDPAPWWDPQYPESAEFYGACFEPMIDVPWQRTTTELLTRGASLGPLRLGARKVECPGFLMATTRRGLEYGKRWLLAQVKGCAGCDGADLEFYLSSPPVDGSNDEMGRWSFRNVGIASVDYSDTDFAELYDATLTFTAADPMLYKAPDVVVEFQTLPVTVKSGTCIPFLDWFCGDPEPSIVATVDPPPFGELATVVTIDSPDGMSGITIDVLDRCTGDPDSGDPTVLSSATIVDLEPGSVFVFDSARERATYYTPQGEAVDGTADHLVIPDGVGLPWLSIASCDDQACLTVRRTRYCAHGEETRVQIETVLRAE